MHFKVKLLILDEPLTALSAREKKRNTLVGRILYDIYHMQIMDGNITETLKKYHEYFRYVHVANLPYRSEPWIGELDYKFILKELSKIYSGVAGFEFFVKEKSFTYEELHRWIQSINF